MNMMKHKFVKFLLIQMSRSSEHGLISVVKKKKNMNMMRHKFVKFLLVQMSRSSEHGLISVVKKKHEYDETQVCEVFIGTDVWVA